MNRRRQILRQQRQRIHQHTTSCDAYAFFNLLTAPELLQRVESVLPEHRERLFPPTETLSMFLAQAMSVDRSCQNAVNDLSIKRACGGLKLNSTRTGAYCKARKRLPVEMVSTLVRHTGSAISDQVAAPWRWMGRPVRLTEKGTDLFSPELPPKNASPEMVRSIDRQNEAALKLSKAGYDVEQLPNVKKNQANPDLKINGELADVASPITGSTYSIWRTINDKVTSQAKNVVLNLADSPLGFEEIAKALNEYPVPGLQRLYLLKNGEFRVFEGGK